MEKTLKIAKTLFRSGQMTEDGKAKRVSISSDVPYLRQDWDGEKYYEILSHTPGDIADDRLKAGLPILFNHRRDLHLGRATTFNNDGHRLDVGTTDDIIWSEGQLGQEKKKDVANGALVGTSVGYSILDDGECTGVNDGIPIYTFKWEPQEFSFCTIEADTTVGAGRNREHSEDDGQIEIRILEKRIDGGGNPPHIATLPKTKNMETATAEESPKINVVDERAAAVKDLQARQKKILEFASAIKNEAWQKAVQPLALEHCAGDADYEAFRTAANNAIDGIRDTSQVNPELGISKNELKRFSFCEMINTFGRTREGVKPAGHYLEASKAVTKLMDGKEPDGMWIPQDVLVKGLQEIHGLGKVSMEREHDNVNRLVRALTATNFSAGGALVGTDLLSGSLIDLLLNNIAFLDGVTYMGGLVGNVAIPRITGPVANSFWLPEGGTVTSNDMSFSQLVLTPKRLASLMVYDKQLVAQASLSVEAVVRNYLARIMAVEKNRAMVNGSGTNGQPLGLLNTPGVQTVAFANAGAPSWKEIVNFETLIEQANADTLGSRSWLTAPGAKGNLKTTGRALTGANVVVAVPIWMDDNTMNGYSAATTQNVPNNQVLFGAGGDFVVGDWAGIDMVVDPYTFSDKAQIRVTINMWTDQGVRHEVAFVVSTNNAA